MPEKMFVRRMVLAKSIRPSSPEAIVPLHTKDGGMIYGEVVDVRSNTDKSMRADVILTIEFISPADRGDVGEFFDGSRVRWKCFIYADYTDYIETMTAI